MNGVVTCRAIVLARTAALFRGSALGFGLVRVTAAQTSAFKASASIFSPSRKSMARLVFPSRLELKRPEFVVVDGVPVDTDLAANRADRALGARNSEYLVDGRRRLRAPVSHQLDYGAVRRLDEQVQACTALDHVVDELTRLSKRAPDSSSQRGSGAAHAGASFADIGHRQSTSVAGLEWRTPSPPGREIATFVVRVDRPDRSQPQATSRRLATTRLRRQPNSSNAIATPAITAASTRTSFGGSCSA